MKITKAAITSGLSTDTIRYYEKSGMLPKIGRSSEGHRDFSQKDVEWLTLLYWLRETGMPVKQMKHFTSLAKSGGTTTAERREILLNHEIELNRRRELIEKCKDVLAIKIASYEDIKEENS